jgi:hypothetical protein
MTLSNNSVVAFLGGILLGGAICAAVISIWPQNVGAQTPTTVVFELEKKFSGPYPDGYTADQFKFDVDGDIVELTAFTDDSANGTIELGVGTYSLSEIGPDGFNPDEWVVQWSGAGCENSSENSTTITIEESDLGKVNFGCRADNQWFPEDEDEPGEGDGGEGTLIVEKVIVGTTTASVSDFSFEFTGTATGTAAFESDGSNSLTVATGTYSVTEVAVSGFTVTYSNCSDVTIDEDETETCIITNTVANGGDGGNGGNGGDEKYRVEGYVWHDQNENDEWEMDDEETDENETDEPPLEGWTVKITNGSVTMSTTTDADGYYFFDVEADTWTITQEVKDSWSQTFPNVNGHVVTVPDDNGEDSLISALITFFLPTAHAQSIETFGPYNFGNVQFGAGGGNGGGNGGGGGGGSGRRSSNDDNNGGGEVLGAQVSPLPVGGAHAGGGGAASPVSEIVNPFAQLFLSSRRNMHDAR